METHYTVYRVTNLKTGKHYTGCHQTKDLNDGYLGSGMLIKKAIENHGIQNFKKEILAVFDNPKDMFECERRLVDKSDPNSYNMKEGGIGGWDHVDKKSDTYRQAMSQGAKKRWKDPQYRKAVIDGLANCGYDFSSSFKGRKHTEETKKRIGATNSIKQKGEKNSNYGMKWVIHPEHGEKKIQEKELDSYLKMGYHRGRKIIVV